MFQGGQLQGSIATSGTKLSLTSAFNNSVQTAGFLSNPAISMALLDHFGHVVTSANGVAVQLSAPASLNLQVCIQVASLILHAQTALRRHLLLLACSTAPPP